jgi:exodeoxyribonuclease III
VKLLSWNVNGIRSVLKKGFVEFVKKEKPDVLCLQETKAPEKALDAVLSEYHAFWNNAKKPGYAGTALFSKTEPLAVRNGIGIPKHDSEGRVQTAEYDGFFLVNVYVPNSQRTLNRLPYRTREWDVDFLRYLKKLEKKKPVVFCGDLNVAHTEIDLTNPKSNVKNHGFTPEERAGFDKVLKSGFVDTFRVFEKNGGHYTWWSRLNDCRRRNIGWRIDYFCISASLKPKLKRAFILKDVQGSDHCPVGIELR